VSAADQLNLPFPAAQFYAAADFMPGSCNAAALAWLEQPRAWPALRLAVYGEAGTGKTHLLHYFVAQHGGAFVPAASVRQVAPLLDAAALAIDDADSVIDDVALLHLLNAAAEHGVPVLLAARMAPFHWDCALPDLVSRLRATPSVALLPPEDDMLRALLRKLLADRQMAVPPRVQEFLLARLPRTGGALRAAVALLDGYSMASGGAVTHAVVQRVVAECGDASA
jgi:chromosomal replication initiation ATPase DnaA